MQRALGTTGITLNAIGYGEWPLSDVNRPPDEVAVGVIREADTQGGLRRGRRGGNKQRGRYAESSAEIHRSVP